MLLYLELVRGREALDFLSFPNIIGIFLGNLKSFLIAHLICFKNLLQTQQHIQLQEKQTLRQNNLTSMACLTVTHSGTGCCLLFSAVLILFTFDSRVSHNFARNTRVSVPHTNSSTALRKIIRDVWVG
jgi:preprotein translocase subunit SecF